MDVRCQIRWLVLGALGPLMLLLSSAAPASASCGDHVQILPAGAKADSDTPTPLPCHGPNCQQAPPQPMPSPVAPSVSVQPHDAVLNSATLVESPGYFRFVSEPILFAQSTITSIFHPPRS